MTNITYICESNSTKCCSPKILLENTRLHINVTETAKMMTTFKLKTKIGHPMLFTRRWASSTIVKERLTYFSQKSDNWWDSGPKGSMKHLHLMNPLRISFIRDQLTLNQSIRASASWDKPFTGLKMVDIGCGVGIAAESLAQLGADVTGIDPSSDLIKAAKTHASKNQTLNGNLSYMVSTAEEYASCTKGLYDVAIVFLILEHIQNRTQFLNDCLQLLKSNGSLFILQANKNVGMYCHYKWNEYVTKMFPFGVAKLHMFMTKSEILHILCEVNGCQLIGWRGLRCDIMGRNILWTKSDKYFNLIHVIKPVFPKQSLKQM